MQRFGHLLSKQLFQQPQFPPSSSRLRYHQSRLLQLQRQLSLSCPALNASSSSNSNDPNDNGDKKKPSSSGAPDITSASSTDYSTISDILNVTTKAREEVQWEDHRSANDRVGFNNTAEDGAGQARGSSFSPEAVINYASGPGGTTRSGVILGIETSCDDTGVAVVNTDKQILGEALNSQLQIHLK
jgi:hypothetical protein